MGGMNEAAISVSTSEGPMVVHSFFPETLGARTLPAVIVLQEAFGVNPHIRRVCLRVAALGHAVFSPELFHRSGPGLEFGYDEFAKARPILGD